jgi:DUF4097 and DUF4098 domain-containing protein YvlB
MKRHWKWICAWVVAAALAAPAVLADDRAVEGSFTRTLKVTGAVDLEVKSSSGSIQVRPGATDSVQVVGKIRARESWKSSLSPEEKVKRLESNPPIEQNGNVIRIGHIEDQELRENVSISYELVVPAATKLRSATGSGSQTVQGLQGPVEATTGSGSLNLSDIGSDVNASTGSGSIELRGVQGHLKASTGSGGIRGTGIAGTAVASTGSGSITIEKSGPGDVEATTGSGGIELSGVRGALRARTGSGSIRAEGQPTAGWRLHTASGGVTVRLPANFGFELNARTSSGGIHSDHPVTFVGTLGRRELRGTVRGGGPLVEISTASGTIRIL